jgi:signal transduction histidine kinase
MRWQRPAIYVALLIAWLAFAAWQYHQYRTQRSHIRESVHQQAHSVMNALVGGIRSHRRLGRFFETQLKGMLEGVVTAKDVLAIEICTDTGAPIFAVGDVPRLNNVASRKPGDNWDADGFCLVESFSIELEDIVSDSEKPGLGMGPGAGQRRGYSRTVGEFAEGGHFLAALLLDRTRADMLTRRAAVSHALVTLAGAVVLFCLALAWRASVRLVEAKGRTRVLEVETRHLRELSQAAAGLAHETRNPLGVIRGWAQRFANGKMPDTERRSHARAMIEECDRVVARINQFLTFARPCQPQLTQVAPCEVVQELEMILQPDLEAKDLTLRCENATPAVIRADRELFRQAMFNLVQNAIQFSPAGGTVAVAIRQDQDNQYRIEIADTGPGVAEEDVDSLFTPYFTTRPDGTGLGLAIVGRIAAAHGWNAAYDSRPDGGAVFYLEGIHG